MRIKKTDNVRSDFRAADGVYKPNQGETPLSGKDSGGNEMKVVAQVADVTKNLASVMETRDWINCVLFHKNGGYINTNDEARRRSQDEDSGDIAEGSASAHRETRTQFLFQSESRQGGKEASRIFCSEGSGENKVEHSIENGSRRGQGAGEEQIWSSIGDQGR